MYASGNVSAARAIFPSLSRRRARAPCLTLELVGHPEQHAVYHGAIIARQVQNSLDDEAAEFDQMPRAFAALDLLGAHVMPRPRRLMPVARRAIAPNRGPCRAVRRGRQ